MSLLPKFVYISFSILVWTQCISRDITERFFFFHGFLIFTLIANYVIGLSLLAHASSAVWRHTNVIEKRTLSRKHLVSNCIHFFYFLGGGILFFVFTTKQYCFLLIVSFLFVAFYYLSTWLCVLVFKKLLFFIDETGENNSYLNCCWVKWEQQTDSYSTTYDMNFISGLAEWSFGFEAYIKEKR